MRDLPAFVRRPSRGVAVALLATVACGGSAGEVAQDAASPGDATSGDSVADAGAGAEAESPEAGSGSDGGVSDSGGLPCGDASCDASQICLYPPFGCVALAPSEAGVCPDGTSYIDASRGLCLPPPPSPSCVSPASVGGSIDCSEGATVPNCDTVNAPIPSGCSRTCYGICV
jgi:hypothetical protein